jgi:hypothetical protein
VNAVSKSLDMRSVFNRLGLERRYREGKAVLVQLIET